jgi:hypothetical protein
VQHRGAVYLARMGETVCILADAADIGRAKQIELEYMNVEDLKKCVALDALLTTNIRLKKNEKLLQKNRQNVKSLHIKMMGNFKRVRLF